MNCEHRRDGCRRNRSRSSGNHDVNPPVPWLPWRCVASEGGGSTRHLKRLTARVNEDVRGADQAEQLPRVLEQPAERWLARHVRSP